MLFRVINDKDFSSIANIQRLTDYDGSEYSLLYLKGWDFFNYPSMEIAQENGVIYLRFKPHDKFNDEARWRRPYIFAAAFALWIKSKTRMPISQISARPMGRICTLCPRQNSM